MRRFKPLLQAASAGGLLIYLAGCVAWQPSYSKISASPAPAVPQLYREYYNYPVRPLTAEIIEEAREKKYIFKKVEFPLHLPEGLLFKDLGEMKRKVEETARTDEKTAKDMRLLYTNRLDCYIPANLKPGVRRPGILISSILGGTMVVDYFAKYYAKRGYVACLVHRKRIYWDDEKEIGQIEDYLRSSVIRLRQALDWMETMPEVHPDRIGAFGISYGAILHVVLAAVEPRIKYHVTAMPAGEIANIIVDCPEKAIIKLVKKVQQLKGWPLEKIREDLQRSIVTDPLYFAPYVPRQKIQVYVSLFDRVVGAERSFRLWKAMGKPELRLIPFGHYGGIILLPYLQSASYLSFRRHLKLPAQQSACPVSCVKKLIPGKSGGRGA